MPTWRVRSPSVNRTPKWRGQRVRYSEVVGFRIVGQGLQLALKGKPWTRWLGPIVHCDDRTLHEVVVHLEGLKIYRVDG